MSETSNPILTETITAVGAVTAYHVVDFTGAEGVAGSRSFGIARTDAADGELIPVDTHGVVPVEAGGAIAIGDDLECDASGHVISGRPQYCTEVNGAGINVNINVPGLLLTDTLLCVLEAVGSPHTAFNDRTAATTIRSAGVIRISTATNADDLHITWRRHIVGVAMEAAVKAGEIIRVRLTTS